MIKLVKKTTTIRSIYLLNMLPIIGLFVYYYTHYLEGTYSLFIPLSLSLVWVALSLTSENLERLLFNKVCVWWMVYLFMCVMMVIIGLSSTNLNFVISRLPIYLIPAMGYFVVIHYNRKEKFVIMAAFFIIYFANLIYNIFLGFQFPYIFEDLRSTTESLEFATSMNIANTFFVEICYMLIGTLLMAVLVIKKKSSRMLYLLVIVPIAYYMLIQNTRGTAILLLMVELVGLFLAFYEPTRYEYKRLYYLISIAMLVIFVLIVFVPLMNLLMEYFQSERLAKRLNDLVDFRMSSGDINNVSSGSFSERYLLAKTSLNSFVSSPLSILIGIGDHTQAFGGDLVKSGIGHHSEFIDVLARLGLVGAFIFWKMMRRYYQMLKNMSSNRMIQKYVIVLFWTIIISGFLNLLFEPILLLFMFIILPSSIELISSQLSCSLSSKLNKYSK